MNVHNGRWLHVYKLWKSALNQESLPQFDRWLSNEFAKNSKYGSKDRRWYSDILFAAVRHGYYALFCLHLSNRTLTENIINEFKQKYTTPEEIFIALRNVDIEEFFKCITVRTENRLNLEGPLKESLGYKLLFHSVPLWFLDDFKQRIEFSKLNQTQIHEFLTNLDSRPPLWIRANHNDKKEDIISEFKKENYLVEEYHDAIKVTGAKGVFTLSSYRNGLFEIQDFASQQIGKHVNATPKQYVWDCCAGGGGKTLQIASFLKNKGVIYASDIREYKLEEVKKRAKRSGFFNIRCLTWNGESLPPFQKEVKIKGGFDWVLVDAPCSSTGTWRRNPDAKYRVNAENIQNLTLLQFNILQKASEGVIPGGHIVYSTCSWLVKENEDIVAKFLEKNTNFSLVEQNLLGSPKENADTMFAAVLKKLN